MFLTKSKPKIIYMAVSRFYVTMSLSMRLLVQSINQSIKTNLKGRLPFSFISWPYWRQPVLFLWASGTSRF